MSFPWKEPLKTHQKHKKLRKKISKNKPIKQYMESNRITLKKSKRALRMGTPENKKDLTLLQSLEIQSGEYRNRNHPF